MTLRRSTIQAVDVACWLLVVVVLVGWLIKTPLYAKGWERRDLNDYTLNLRHSREVDSSHQYPFGFTYPPPSVLLRLGFGSLGFDVGGGIWIALSAAALIVSLVLAIKMRILDGAPGCGLLALTSLLLVKYPFEFEYKYLNSNAMFLALVLMGISLLDSRPSLAGLFLSLSIALKLYSIVFLPWLLWTRRTRVAVWTALFSLLLFSAPPILHWGWESAWEISRSWIDRVQETGSPHFPVEFLPFAYLVSLHATVLTALERFGVEDSRAAALWATRFLQALWIAGVAFALRKSSKERGSRSTLIDACLLLLSPLPLSGQLQPHHAVVLLPASILLLFDAVDRDRTRLQRIVCAVVLLGGFLIMEYGPTRPWRGLAMNSTFVFYLIGLTAAKSRSNLPSTPVVSPSSVIDD